MFKSDKRLKMIFSADGKRLLKVTNNDLKNGEFILPDTVTHIGDDAFRDCTGLTQVTIPDSVEHIGNSAFRGCERLTQVTIPNSVKHIGGNAFRDCESLTQVTIPDSVEHIGDNAFGACERLTQVTIPNSVKHIGNDPFANCRNLQVIAIEDKNMSEYLRLVNLLPLAQQHLARPMSLLKEARDIKQEALKSVAACLTDSSSAFVVAKLLDYKGTIAGDRTLPVKQTTLFKSLNEGRVPALLKRRVPGSISSELVPVLGTEIFKPLPAHAQILEGLYYKKAKVLHPMAADIPLPANSPQVGKLFQSVTDAALKSVIYDKQPSASHLENKDLPEASKKRKQPDDPDDNESTERPSKR